jgi:hypothetical protein
MALPIDRLLRRAEPRAPAERRHAAARGDDVYGVKGYWPAVAETSEVSITVIANPDVADFLREIGRRNNEIRKVVVSDSVTEDGTAPRTRTTTILRRARMRDRPLPSSRLSRARTSSCSRAGRSGTNCWPPGSSTSYT